jgi:hypothetical protein
LISFYTLRELVVSRGAGNGLVSNPSRVKTFFFSSQHPDPDHGLISYPLDIDGSFTGYKTVEM